MNDTIPESREGVIESENNLNNVNYESNVIEQEGLMASRYYQVWNPRLKRWVKMDSSTGRIVAVKKTKGEYKNLPKKKTFWDKFFG